MTSFTAWPAERVTLPGLTLSVRHAAPTSDDAEPALLVHGLGGSALNWTDLMGLLRDRLDSRAPDLPGFGLSAPPDDGDYSPAGHARAVVRLLEHDARGPVHLFGNSLGGAVATIVAASRPELVRTLTLVSPALPAFVLGRWRLQVAAMATPGVGPALSKYVSKLPAEVRLQRLLELVYADPSAVPEERRAAALQEVLERQQLTYAADALGSSARGLMRAFMARGHASLWEQARSVHVPTLVFYGAADRLVHHSAAARVRSTFPQARTVLLPRTGHVAQMEHPELVARFVREHLDQHLRRSDATG